jgi:hypothetical protein
VRPVVLLLLTLAACRPAASTSPASQDGRTWPTVRPLGDTMEAPPFDRELVADVEQRLRIDSTIDASRVGVEADAGRVRLFGTVTTEAQKERAVELAWVAGVVDVDANALDVWPFRDPDGSRPASSEPVPSEDETRNEPGEVVFGPEL